MSSNQKKYAPNFKHLHDNQDNGTKTTDKDINIGIVIKRLSPLVKLPDTLNGYTYNLYAHDFYSVWPNDAITLKTGLKICLPPNYLATIFDIEGNLSNIITQNLNLEMTISWQNQSGDILHFEPRDKIGEIVFQKINEIRFQCK